MDLTTLESWLWKAACSIRGEIDAARYKDYILPLVFYKRLDDVYADEVARVACRLDLVEYVVLHELLRLKFPAHRRGWLVKMGIYLSNWQEREHRLQAYTVTRE